MARNGIEKGVAMMFAIVTSSLQSVDERGEILQLQEFERGRLGSNFLSRLHYQEFEGSGQISEY